jgi:DnaK suppressor protein
MNDLRTRLDRELKTAVSRLQQLGNAVGVAKLPPSMGDNGLFNNKLEEARRAGSTTRQRLLDRVNHLSAAIDRVIEGEYGLCEDCGAPISLARLDVMPEVQTCVSCDDGGGRHGL